MFQHPETKICPKGQNLSISPDQNMSQGGCFNNPKPKYVPGGGVQNVSIPLYCILLKIYYLRFTT